MKMNTMILGFCLTLMTFTVTPSMGLAKDGSAGATKPMATALNPDEIIKTIERNLAPPDVKYSYEFTNTRSDGTVTQYVIDFESRDVDRMRGFFKLPEREKGREVLRLQDNLWTWMPSVARVVRIADRDSFAGGDFSNADVMRADWSSKYNVHLAKETPNQWILDLTAKSTEAPYSKMRLWVDKKTTQPVQQQYYDAKGTLLKRCLYGSVRDFGKIRRPTHLLMENVISRQKSELKVLDIKLDQKIPDSRFVVDNLGK